MKLHVLMFVLFAILADVHAEDYKGIVYIRKTGIDEGFSVDLETVLIFESQVGVRKQSTDSLQKNFIFTDSNKGRNVLEEDFLVVGDLNKVRLTVVEKDSFSQQTVCDKEIPGSAISPGSNNFKCVTNTGPGGMDTKWIVNLRVIK